MKKIILSTLLLQFLLSSMYGQLFNDGAAVTIQPDAFIHIQGDFTNQGGEISNEGLIEIAGNWENTVMTNPLTPGSGLVNLVGTTQTFGGDFPTLFNDVTFRDNQMVTLTTTMGIGNSIAINNGSIDLNRNTLHLLNPLSSALTSTQGGLLAETSDVYGFVRWDLGETNNQTYAIPFANALGTSLPLTFEQTAAGQGEEGYILFSTYSTSEDNSPLPLGVTNINVNGDDTGNNVIDRFWIIDTVNYSVAPQASVGFTFDQNNETGGTNNISLDNLIAINYDVDTQVWGNIEMNNFDGTTLTATTGDNYGNFAIFSDETTAVDQFEAFDQFTVFPNPVDKTVQVRIDGIDTESMDVLLVDVLGRVVYHSQMDNTAFHTELDIDVSQLATGMYTLIIQGESKRGIQKLNKI